MDVGMDEDNTQISLPKIQSLQNKAWCDITGQCLQRGPNIQKVFEVLVFANYFVLKPTLVPSLRIFSAPFWRKLYNFPVLSLNPEPFSQATYYQHHTNKSPRSKVFLCDSLWTQTRISTRLLPRNSVPVIWVTAKSCFQQALLSWTQYQLKDKMYQCPPAVYILKEPF